MKNLKKFGAALLAVVMLCSMSVVAFADGDVNAVVGGTVADSEISINNAKVKKSTGILTVTLDYSISGGVAAGDQITMLGYIFTTGENASEILPVEGSIRAIDQATAVAENGKISFKLATTGIGDYIVDPEAKMVVKLGSNATNVTKAQAFFIDLAKVTETGEPHLYGDVNGNNGIDAEDWMIVLNHQTENIPSADLAEGNWQFNAADINANGGIDAEDWMIILNHQTENIPSDVVGTEFIF